MPGATPELILYDDLDEEISREFVSRDMSYEQLHSYVQSLGFERLMELPDGRSVCTCGFMYGALLCCMHCAPVRVPCSAWALGDCAMHPMHAELLCVSHHVAEPEPPPWDDAYNWKSHDDSEDQGDADFDSYHFGEGGADEKDYYSDDSHSEL